MTKSGIGHHRKDTLKCPTLSQTYAPTYFNGNDFFRLKPNFLYTCSFFVRLDGLSPAILRVPLVGANILFSPFDSQALLLMQVESTLFTHPKYRSEQTEAAPFLPMSRKEMKKLGWDSCDIIIVTGDAYVDHPSFGMAVIGRMLESQGFRGGIISQPDWSNKEDFMKLGKPNLYFGVTSGNMDSMINRYTAERRMRHDDAYTAGNIGGKRPDRAVTVYTQRCRKLTSRCQLS